MDPRALAGPPGQTEGDTRLSALQSNRAGIVDEPGQESLIKSLLPLIGAQAADLVSTEHILSQNGQPNAEGNPMRAWENNPLPGMSHSMGRIGWGALEAALAALLLKKKPGLGRAMVNTMVPIHQALASGNEQIALSGLVDKSRLIYPQMTQPGPGRR